jgi:hypothetical protein
MKELNEESETHLWDGSFAELVVEYIDTTEEQILILTGSLDHTPPLKDSIEDTLGTKLPNTEVHNDHHSKEELPYEIPFKPNAFDLTIQVNPTRDAYHRHNPIYEAERVTKQGGTIISKASNYIAHSNWIDYEDIYAVGYENGPDVSVCAVGNITTKGCINSFLPPQLENSSTESPRQPTRITKTASPSSKQVEAQTQTSMEEFL